VLPGATVTLSNPSTGFSQTEIANEIGAFNFPQLAVGTYKLTVELEGFKTANYDNVVINVGQTYSVSAKLEIGARTEVVQVTAGELLVKTSTPEVSSVVMQKQVLEIPLANRDVTNLIKAQAGVAGISNRTSTTINGGRPTWTQVTLDGINIQDNFIRTNSLDFLPNRPNSDNVAEFSITTSVSGADSAGGATSVRMVTPSGTNTFRGSVFEFNRDSKFSANSFFNNASRVAKPRTLASPVRRAPRRPHRQEPPVLLRQLRGLPPETQTSQNLTIPANADFLNGVPHVDLTGQVRSVNVMLDRAARRHEAAPAVPVAAAGRLERQQLRRRQLERKPFAEHGRLPLQPDRPQQPRPVHVPPRLHDDRQEPGSRASQLLQRRPTTAPISTASARSSLVYTSSDPKRYALAWRWIGSANFQNELRYGANLAPHSSRATGTTRAWACSTTRTSVDQPGGRQRHGGRLHAAGPLHEHLPVQRERQPDVGQPPDPGGRQLAAQSRQPA
jgi:hypothetical protein